MSEERTVLRIGGDSSAQKPMNETLDNKEISDKVDSAVVKDALSRAERKARMARVLERGMTGERLQVELPPELHGEWAPIRLIDYYRSLGYTIDTEHARNRSLHARPELGGVECAVVGDAVYMTQPMEDYEIYEELRMERFVKMNAKPDAEGERVKQLEERAFAQNLNSLTEGRVSVPVIDSSKARDARKNEIQSAMAAAAQRSGAAAEFAAKNN